MPTSVNYLPNDRNIKVIFNLSANCNELTQRFLTAAEQDEGLVEVIGTYYDDALYQRAGRAMEKLPEPEVEGVEPDGTNKYTVILPVPDYLRAILNDQTICAAAKDPVLLMQVEENLLYRNQVTPSP